MAELSVEFAQVQLEPVQSAAAAMAEPAAAAAAEPVAVVVFAAVAAMFAARSIETAVERSLKLQDLVFVEMPLSLLFLLVSLV